MGVARLCLTFCTMLTDAPTSVRLRKCNWDELMYVEGVEELEKSMLSSESSTLKRPNAIRRRNFASAETQPVRGYLGPSLADCVSHVTMTSCGERSRDTCNSHVIVS